MTGRYAAVGVSPTGCRLAAYGLALDHALLGCGDQFVAGGEYDDGQDEGDADRGRRGR